MLCREISIRQGGNALSHGTGLGPRALQRSVDSNQRRLKRCDFHTFRSFDTRNERITVRINGRMKMTPCLATLVSSSLGRFGDRLVR